MKVIDQINGSALFAQSAYSASIATKDDLGRDITATYLTSHQDLSDYAKSSALNDYQTTAGMTAYQPVGDYATTADLAEKQDTLTFGYDEQDRINSINSSALAGGGDVPEDVMVETGLGYNAVGEISGYGNSAIAQYGAEKQWLVHDDTIVHISNSAQYAFGCNISALQRLMGIDETVLYEAPTSAGATNIVLPESWKNFDRIKVDYYTLNDGVPFSREFQTKYQRADRVDFETYTYAAGGMYWKEGQFAFTTDTNFDAVTGMWYYTNSKNQLVTATGNEIVILGITGIGRKA